jgi:hypothetical protein
MLHFGEQSLLLRSGREHAGLQKVRVKQWSQDRVTVKGESTNRRKQEINSKDHLLIVQLTILAIDCSVDCSPDLE